MIAELKNAYEAALQVQANQRNQKLTPFARRVSESICTAGLFALEDSSQNLAQYRVVSAPTGSGKSSYAQAFIKAYVETIPDATVLYLVETIRQAEDIYRDITRLIGIDKVAIWTAAYDEHIRNRIVFSCRISDRARSVAAIASPLLVKCGSASSNPSRKMFQILSWVLWAFASESRRRSNSSAPVSLPRGITSAASPRVSASCAARRTSLDLPRPGAPSKIKHGTAARSARGTPDD